MRQDAERLARRTRQRLAVGLIAAPLLFILLAETPEPHPVLVLAFALYALHLAVLLRPVWTGCPYRVPRSVLLVPALAWPIGLGFLPHTGAFERAGAVPLAGMAVVPVAVLVAELPVRARLAGGVVCCGLAAVVNPHAPLPSVLTVGGVLLTVFVVVRGAMRPVAAISRLGKAVDAAALLAVAEERMRLSRDLHDTLGRHLAVIAIKSELVAATGKLEEMVEVQVLARASQGELQAVVNAVRTATLDDELRIARCLLRACGIRCETRVEQSGRQLGHEVQVALGWAVREAATNVIRHATAATACTITLTLPGGRESGHCVLEVVNDGVRERSERSERRPGAGTGIDGLEQRVAPLGGGLEHGPQSGGRYRLAVTVPLGEGVETA